MRNAFAKVLTDIIMENEKTLLLSGDIGNRLFDNLKSNAGNRFINCGIAECNMMGVAAGLALSGYYPIVYTITPFITTRCFEQIRVDVCYHGVPVIIVGTGAGLAYASLGPTHHSCEDIAILRTLPNMTVFCPADSIELECGLRSSISQLKGPLYIRLGKKGEPILHKEKLSFSFGKSITLKEGEDVCFVSTGTITSVALETAQALKNMGISVQVESFHTVKPIDTKRLNQIFNRYPLVVIIEEHSRIGGLYGAVSEYYTKESPFPCRILSCAVDDEFLYLIGTQDIARAKYGLCIDNIYSLVVENLKHISRDKGNASRVGFR